MKSNGVKVVVRKPNEQDELKKKYTDGSWKVNFKDSTIHIHFENKNIPELNYKFSYLANGSVNFQESSTFDSVFNGKKVTIKKQTIFPTKPFIQGFSPYKKSSSILPSQYRWKKSVFLNVSM